MDHEGIGRGSITEGRVRDCRMGEHGGSLGGRSVMGSGEEEEEEGLN